MSSTATSFDDAGISPQQRLEVLFDELAEVTGQRNALDGRIVEIVAEIDRDGLWGATGFRSVPSLVACRTGVSPHTAKTITTVAHRITDFPECTTGMRQGWLSLDQVGVIANNAGEGSDAHYAQFARHATVTQLRTAIKQEPRPAPQPSPEPRRSITQTSDDESTTWRITLPHDEAAQFDAALQSHQDALIAAWKRDHPDGATETTPPLPNTVDGFMSLVHAGWDTDVTRRPHGQRTTVVVHVDVDKRVAALHLGPLLTDDDRRYLTCDATCEVWFERHGQPIGSGRETRTINRRLRRALEHRDRCCGSRGVAPPAACTPTTSSTGKTAGPPTWTTWYCCARTTTGPTTGASSPSPDPPTTSWSPTLPADHSPHSHWPAPRPHPHPRSHHVPDQAGNAPTGGGTTPTHHPHQETTSWTGRGRPARP